MNFIFMAVGAITSLAVAIALLAYAYNVISEWREHRECQRMNAAREKVARQIGQNLLNESYWFGESKETFTALNMTLCRLPTPARIYRNACIWMMY